MANIPEIELCVRGEGEYTAWELIRYGSSLKKRPGIPGISYRAGRKINVTPARALICDTGKKGAELDMLPSPYLTGVLDPAALLANSERIPILTSRGCVYKCTYCNCSPFSRQTIRFHSAQRVVAELSAIKRSIGARKEFGVEFDDDTFTLNKKRTEQISRGIIRRTGPVRSVILTRADCVDAKTLALLRRTGVKKINFSLESASPRVLYHMHKVRLRYDGADDLGPEKRFISRVKSAVAQAKKLGFTTAVSVLFGLPQETREDAIKTLRFIDSLKVSHYYHNYLRVFAGTPLFDARFGRTAGSSESRFDHPSFTLRNFKPRYDIFSLPVNSNEYSCDRINTDNALIQAEALMGLRPRQAMDSHIRTIISLAARIPARWLIHNCHLDSWLTFSPAHHDMKMHTLSLASSIARRFKNDKIELRGFEDRYLGHLGNRYLVRPYESLSGNMKNPPGRSVLLTITNGASLKNWIKDITRERRTLRASLLKHQPGCLVLDACRWMDTCPARNASRLVVNKDLSLVPCQAGERIGAAGDRVHRIRKNFAAYLEKARKKRGCGSCPIQERCSQCPFLGSVHPDAYCRAKIKYHREMKRYFELMTETPYIKQYVQHS